MTEIEEIYRGMQNGAETINENFEKLTEALDLSQDVPLTPLTMASDFTANSAEYCIKGGWIFITVQGARPKATITGQSYYTFLTLPAAITKHISHTEGFMWSNFQGGGVTYSGGILNNGQVQLYLTPTSNSLASNHRFSFNMTIPLRTTENEKRKEETWK